MLVEIKKSDAGWGQALLEYRVAGPCELGLRALLIPQNTRLANPDPKSSIVEGSGMGAIG